MTALHHISYVVDTKACHEYRGDRNKIIILDIKKMEKMFFHEQFIVEIIHLYHDFVIIYFCCFRFQAF